MQSINYQDTPLLNAELYNSAQDECILYNTDSGEAYKITGIASKLCRLFDGRKKLSVCIEEICAEEKINHNEFEEEFINIIQELLDKKIILLKHE